LGPLWFIYFRVLPLASKSIFALVSNAAKTGISLAQKEHENLVVLKIAQHNAIAFKILYVRYHAI
jgi:predicted secreted protein